MKKLQTTNAIAVRESARRYSVNTKHGSVYNADGERIGSTYSEPRISVRIQTPNGPKKYGVRLAKLIGYVAFGSEAIQPNVEVRHKDGDKYNNAARNLVLVRRYRGDLTKRQVLRVRNLVDRGLPNTEIAERTGASRHQVRRIANGSYASIQ